MKPPRPGRMRLATVTWVAVARALLAAATAGCAVAGTGADSPRSSPLPSNAFAYRYGAGCDIIPRPSNCGHVLAYLQSKVSIIDQHLLSPTVVTRDSTGTRGAVSFTVLGDVQDTQARLDISVHLDFHVNSQTAERSLYAGAGSYRGWTLAVSYRRISPQHTNATAKITAPA